MRYAARQMRSLEYPAKAIAILKRELNSTRPAMTSSCTTALGGTQARSDACQLILGAFSCEHRSTEVGAGKDPLPFLFLRLRDGRPASVLRHVGQRRMVRKQFQMAVGSAFERHREFHFHLFSGLGIGEVVVTHRRRRVCADHDPVVFEAYI